MKLISCLWCVVALVSFQVTALPIDPMLRIESVEHTAMINKIAGNGHYLVTVSDDKTARVWDVSDGRLLNVLRIPVAASGDGKLYAVALSPDGQTVALGGDSRLGNVNNNIYLFDRGSGRMLRRLSAIPDVVRHLAFSPDGKTLAAALGRVEGVRLFSFSALRLFSVADGRQIAEDHQYGADSTSVHFSGDGRLVSTSYDGYLRVYSLTGEKLELLSKRAAPGGINPCAARFSPDGQYIATGFADTSNVNVLNSRDLTIAYVPDIRGVKGDLYQVAWSLDGKTLYAAGEAGSGDYKYVRRWQDSGKGMPTDWNVARKGILDLVALPLGKLAFASDVPEWGVVDINGRRTISHLPATADFRAGDMTLSSDGSKIGFGDSSSGKASAIFDAASRRFLLTDVAGLDNPIVSAPDLKVDDWKNTSAPELNGEMLDLETDEVSHSMALLPDGNGLVLGTDWKLRLYDRRGKQRWQQSVPGAVWAVNVSRDGRWVVAAYGDGTIRWHRASDGEEQLALFPHADNKRWIMWTPQGYYDASGADAEEFVGWHMNRGKDTAAEFYPGSRFRNVFYRPDVIQQVFKTAAPVQNLAGAASVLREHPAPVVKLQELPTQVEGDSLSLSLAVQDQGGGIGDVRVFINGTSVQGKSARGLAVTVKAGNMLSLPVRLVPGKNEISVIAFNADNSMSSNPAEAVVISNVKVQRKPNLHALVVGIQEFENSRLNLQYTRGDAEAVKQLLETRSKGLFEQVDVQLLTSPADTSKSAIEAAFARYKSSVAPDDVFLFYVASHGIIDGESMADKSYYLVTSNVGSTATKYLKQDALSQEALRRLIADVPATKKLVLLDTCHAGDVGSKLLGRGLDEDSAVKLLSRATGIAVIAASTSAQQALEGYHGHGVFTYVLLEGMSGKADASDRGYVTPIGLADYVTEQVPDVTERTFKSRQYPTFNIEGQPFPIVRSK